MASEAPAEVRVLFVQGINRLTDGLSKKYPAGRVLSLVARQAAAETLDGVVGARRPCLFYQSEERAKAPGEYTGVAPQTLFELAATRDAWAREGSRLRFQAAVDDQSTLVAYAVITPAPRKKQEKGASGGGAPIPSGEASSLSVFPEPGLSQAASKAVERAATATGLLHIPRSTSTGRFLTFKEVHEV